MERVIKEVSRTEYIKDAITFDTNKLILRRAQTAGEYDGVNCSFSANLFTTKMPLLIDIGFNDMIIPKPQKISYPTLLEMPCPILLGYTLETAFAEKLESIVKLASVNTRMKDFYDIWTMTRNHQMNQISLNDAIQRIFANRGTPLKYPVAFTPAFYDLPEAKRHWKQFLLMIGREPIPFEEVIIDLSAFINKIIDFS